MKISILGAGSFGTAFGALIARRSENQVTLVARDPAQAMDINDRNVNPRYLDNIVLPRSLCATVDFREVENSKFVFLALPSRVIAQYVESHLDTLRTVGCIVNLAKGFVFDRSATIVDYLETCISGNVVIGAAKGPTFATDMLLSPASGMTIATTSDQWTTTLEDVLSAAGICIDRARTLAEVEYLSILKNVYAITMGIVEARSKNPNLRAVVFTRCIREMAQISSYCIGHSADVFLYAGVGDLLLTGLDDQSRNRTFGLMLGKGFAKPGGGDSEVVVEGFRSIEFMSKVLPLSLIGDLQIFSGLLAFMRREIDTRQFIHRVLH